MIHNHLEHFNVEPLEIDTLNASISSQNDRYIEAADSISTPRLRTIVQGDITEEQGDTFQLLIEKTVSQPYELLGAKAVQLLAELKNAEDTDAVLNAANSERLLLLEREIAIAERLAPRRTEEIKLVEAEEKERIKKSLHLSLIAGIQSELEQVNDELSHYTEAWPIPQAISGADRALYFELIQEELSKADPDTFVEDIIPVTPDERMHQVSIAEKAKRAVGIKDAKHYIAYYLAERVGMVVSVEELARFLYIASVEERRSNVTTLLGPKVQGKHVQRHLLEEYGLRLQYGWRKLKEADGSQGQRTRIYRAVQSEDTANERLVYDRPLVDGALVQDNFEMLRPKEADAESEETATQEPEYIEVKADIPQQEEESVPSKNDQPSWAEELTQATHDVIDKLIADNLFKEDEMKGTAIRALSSSRVIGTETMRARMYDAGLLRISQSQQDKMNREQRVIGALLNTHSDILSRQAGRAKQKRSLEIVKSVIQQRLS